MQCSGSLILCSLQSLPRRPAVPAAGLEKYLFLVPTLGAGRKLVMTFSV